MPGQKGSSGLNHLCYITRKLVGKRGDCSRSSCGFYFLNDDSMLSVLVQFDVEAAALIPI